MNRRSILSLAIVLHVGTGCSGGGAMDSGVSDGGVMDSGVSDGGVMDSGVSDGGVMDSGRSDAGVDGGPPDSGSVDAGSSDGGNDDAGAVDGGPSDSGTTDGGSSGRFSFVTLDAADAGLRPLSLAVDPAGRVGVAYFADVPGHAELRYVEWAPDAGTVPVGVKTVDIVSGVSLAFDPNGRPAIAYLGGGSDTSLVWLQSDAVIARRQIDGGWLHETVVQFGNEALANDVTSDRGFLVGLHASLVFDGSKQYLAYRDAHDGTYPQQDWAGSDLELAEGQTGAWSRSVVFAGGNDKQAWGGHNQLVMGRTQPALVSDQMFSGADATGTDVWFTQRNVDAGWSPKQKLFSATNTQLGPAVAYDTDAGFAATVFDVGTGTLFVKTSLDGVTWSSTPSATDAGASGWYPSPAFNPASHALTIAYYHCAAVPSASTCSGTEDELRVAIQTDAGWSTLSVDSRGAYQPRLAFSPGGKMLIAYRDPRTGALLLAIER